ncbi:tape measure protein [Aquamicrobium soli]|uniref:Tape measure protein n=1 Tax=Aquamicrobium soli TaxID=1811518 RepID=A0ABV7KC50_9HYPH
MATDLEKLVVQLSADFKAFERGMARAQGVSNRQFNAIERRARLLDSRLGAIGKSAARNLIAPISGLGAALGTREIARYADTWTEAGNKIRAAGQIAGVTTRSLNGIKDLANETRSGFAETADLYAKLIRSASGVAKSEEEIATAVKVVNEAFKAGGASTSEQVNGIMQLSQALGSGLLQGDELRSIRENAPILAQAIAKEFSTTVAGLKKLGAEGELVSSRILKAILGAQKEVGAAFAQTNSTIADAITRVRNEFTAYIGNANEATGASKQLVEALQFLADNFKGVADVVVQFATVVIAALTGRALLGMVAGLGNAVVALGAFLTALRAGTLAATGFTAALGPIGLLAGAAAAAIFLLYRASDSAEGSTKSFERAMRSNEAAITNATDATYAQVDALRKLIATQLEAAKSSAALAQADFETALGRKDAFAAITGGGRFAPFDYALDEADKRVTATGVAVDKLEEQLGRVDKILTSKPSGYGRGGPAVDSDGSGKRKRADPFESAMRRVSDRTAEIVAETEAQRKINPLVNDYGYALEKARVQQELMNAAQKAGKEITPELRKQIEAAAEQYAVATAEAAKFAEQQDKIRQAAEEAQQAARDFAGTLVDGLLEGKSATEALADALKQLASRLISSGLDQLFGMGSGNLSPWGAIGSLLFGGGSSGGSWASANAGFASGTANTGGRRGEPIGIVHGQEAVIPLPTGGKVPVQIQAPTMPAIQASGAGSSVVVHFNPVIDNRGASVEAVTRTQQQLDKLKAQLPSIVTQSVRQANKSNVKF